MREIRFRSWNNADERWLQEDQFHIFPSGYVDAWEGDEEVENKDVILMQFTGLKDKNEKEIYEGDIVVIKSTYETDEPITMRTQVIFRDGAFETDAHGMLVRGAKKGNWEFEVIGNIYENPGLLRT